MMDQTTKSALEILGSPDDLKFRSCLTLFREAASDKSDRVLFTARRPAVLDKMSKGTTNMKDHETRRKIIREWMALPKDKRQTEEQVAAFAKKGVEQNEFHRSRRDPHQNFGAIRTRKIMGWLLPRAGKS
jgi:hypothetical protein